MAKGRAFELSESQATGIEKPLESTSISEEVVQAVGPSNRVPAQQQASRTRQDSVTQPQCRNCGGPWPHSNNICPAKGKSCLNCGKPNHFAKVCRSATRMSHSSQHDPRQSTKMSHKVRKVCVKPGNSESSSEEEFIFTLKSTSKHNTPLIQISVNNIPINMVIDTGASIGIIDEHTFNTVRQNAPIALQRSSTHIFAYGATTQLPVMGKFEATLACSTGSTTSQIHVIKGNFGCLLSYQTVSALGLIMININKLQPEYTGHEQLLKEYAHLFDGLYLTSSTDHEYHTPK